MCACVSLLVRIVFSYGRLGVSLHGSVNGGSYCRDVDDGRIRIPGKNSIAHGCHKLDCLSVLWEREFSETSDFIRCIMADSSLKSYNDLCTRESTFKLPKTRPTDGAWGRHDLQFQFSTFAWQLSVLGYGASNLAYKFRNIVHTMLLKCKDEEAVRAFRYSVVGWTSDQGPERKLADVAFGTRPNLESLRRIVSDVSNNALPLSDNTVLDCYMWPVCLIMSMGSRIRYCECGRGMLLVR